MKFPAEKSSKLSVLALGTIWILGFFIAVFSGNDLLEKFSPISHFVSGMRVVFDPRELMSRSKFPEVTLLYYSIVWWSFPVWFFVWLRWMGLQVTSGSTGIAFKQELSSVDKVVLLLLLPLWIALSYAFTLNHGGDTRLIEFGTSRLQLGLFGMAFPLGMAFCVAASVFSIKRIFGAKRKGQTK